MAMRQDADSAPDQPRGQHRRHEWQEHLVYVESAGAGGDQSDTHDPSAEEFRLLLGECENGHATHGMADQDDWAGRCRFDHPAEVATELIDRRLAAGRAAGTSVRALVIEDGPHQAAIRQSLEVPAVQVQGEAVREDDRDL